jgi:hypothetical protein
MFSICSRFSDEELSRAELNDEKREPNCGYLQSALAILSESLRQLSMYPELLNAFSTKLSSLSPVDCSSITLTWIPRVWHGYDFRLLFALERLTLHLRLYGAGLDFHRYAD